MEYPRNLREKKKSAIYYVKRHVRIEQRMVGLRIIKHINVPNVTFFHTGSQALPTA